MDGVTQDENKVKEAWESVNHAETRKQDNRAEDYEEIRNLIQNSLATGDISKSCPLSIDELKQLYSRIQDDVKQKERHLQKISQNHTRRVNEASQKGHHDARNRSQDSETSSIANRNGSQDKNYKRLRGDLVQIADRLKAAEDLDVMAKIEAVIKNKEAECEMLERKAMALKTLSSMKEHSELMGDTQNSKQFHKRMDKLHKEVRHNDDLQNKLSEQIGRKDENLKKHTEVVERLYDKYRAVCNKYKVEPRIYLEKNQQGVIDVVLPDDAKIGKQIDLKKHDAELKLTKSNKISECQRRFLERVEKKELPSLKEWIAKQENLYLEIKKKIDKCNDLYEKYKDAGNKSPIDSNVFERFERLRQIYDKDFKFDTSNIHKVETILSKF